MKLRGFSSMLSCLRNGWKSRSRAGINVDSLVQAWDSAGRRCTSLDGTKACDNRRGFVMALSVVNGDLPRQHAPVDWAAVQFAQFEHDEKYHREISRLSMQDRLRHMALHFAKYAGRLHEGPSDEVIKRTAVDSLIIAVSCANILNRNVSNIAELEAGQGEGFEQFARTLTVAAGKMAGACERIDHLEDFPFRSAISEQVEVILVAAFRFISGLQLDPIDEMASRLSGVKAKSIFHGRL
ncbi:hypothetical protein [Aurantiacibacter gilvus]|uniref:Uncharacterized protein n=1 Tax=Aurantiacibacter gilvus TaxID=3139141 RepID=A0ABU9IHH4_9SPHN